MESNVLDILRICYDSADQVRPGAYLVQLNGQYKIIDKDNRVLLDIGKGRVVATGYKLYISLDYYFNEYSLDSFIKVKETRYTDIQWFSENALIVTTNDMEQKGLINKYGDVILPTMYKTIKIFNKTSTHDIVYARPSAHMIRYYGSYSKFSYENIDTIAIRNDYMQTDELFNLKTTNPDVYITAVSYRATEGKYETKFFDLKYRLKVNGKLVGKEYTDIFYSDILLGEKYTQVYSYNNILDRRWSSKVGIQTIDGEEIIEPLFKEVTYIGNNIFIVGLDGYGVTVGKQFIYPSGTFDEYITYNKIPIILFKKDNQQYILGTDGRVHSNMSEAFDMYVADENPDIYLIMLYNGLVLTDKELNRVTNLGTVDEVKNRYTWRKLQ